MGKSKDKRNSRRSRAAVRTVSAADVSSIREWLHRMEAHASNAIALSGTLKKEELNESSNDFWALVKYAENVQECVVQLDNVKRSILEALEEIPIRSDKGVDLTWTGLKGMRARLAHQFWNIEPETLWETVTTDFPVLQKLLSVLVVGEPPETTSLPGIESHFVFHAPKLMNLPLCNPDEPFTLGNSLVLMDFGTRGHARCVRVAKETETKMIIKAFSDEILGEMVLSLVGNGEVRQVAHWVHPLATSTNDC